MKPDVCIITNDRDFARLCQGICDQLVPELGTKRCWITVTEQPGTEERGHRIDEEMIPRRTPDVMFSILYLNGRYRGAMGVMDLTTDVTWTAGCEALWMVAGSQ